MVSLTSMLDYLSLVLEGRLHSGMDDAKNIARVLLQMLCDGAVVLPNEGLSARKAKTKIMSQVDPERDLAEQLSKMSVSAVTLLRVLPTYFCIGKIPTINLF